MTRTPAPQLSRASTPHRVPTFVRRNHAQNSNRELPLRSTYPDLGVWFRTPPELRLFTCEAFGLANNPSLPPLTTHHLRLPNHLRRGGTVNRPRAHVSHRKQTTERMQGRNFPVHFLFSFLRLEFVVAAPDLRQQLAGSLPAMIGKTAPVPRLTVHQSMISRLVRTVTRSGRSKLTLVMAG